MAIARALVNSCLLYTSEMGWPLGFKLANLCPRYLFLFLALSAVSMGVSGWLLYVAQRTIPMEMCIRDRPEDRLVS